MTEKLTYDDICRYNQAPILCFKQAIPIRNIERINQSENYIDTFNDGRFYIEECQLRLREFRNGLSFEEQTEFLGFCKNQIREIKGDMFWKLKFQEVIKYIKKYKIVDCINWLRSKNICVDEEMFKNGKAVAE